jgi:TPR repeat protein
MLQYASALREGAGVVCDSAAAVRWFRRAADAGPGTTKGAASCALGDMLRTGAPGVTRDPQAALGLYWAAIGAGWAPALTALGWWLRNGDDPAAGVALLKRAALAGDLDGMTSYALSLRHGVGTPQNCVDAAAWGERAAARGSSVAGNNLAVLLLRGAPGVARDAKQAYDWWKVAACGDAPRTSCMVLADAYERGTTTVAVDRVAALAWYRRAAAADPGCDEACNPWYRRAAAADPGCDEACIGVGRVTAAILST